MTDEPLGALHGRIAALEAELAEARRRRHDAPRALAAARARVQKLKKEAGELERGVTRRRRSAHAPVRIRNSAALLFSLVGLAAFAAGLALQVRVASAPLVWLETTCRVSVEDENTFAYPAARASGSFRTSGPAADRAPCWIPDDPVGDGLGARTRPPSTRMSLAEKLRALYSAMMLVGLGGAGSMGWLAILTPAESSD